jgi:hypothetical protein
MAHRHGLDERVERDREVLVVLGRGRRVLHVGHHDRVVGHVRHLTRPHVRGGTADGHVVVDEVAHLRRRPVPSAANGSGSPALTPARIFGPSSAISRSRRRRCASTSRRSGGAGSGRPGWVGQNQGPRLPPGAPDDGGPVRPAPRTSTPIVRSGWSDVRRGRRRRGRTRTRRRRPLGVRQSDRLPAPSNGIASPTPTDASAPGTRTSRATTPARSRRSRSPPKAPSR